MFLLNLLFVGTLFVIVHLNNWMNGALFFVDFPPRQWFFSKSLHRNLSRKGRRRRKKKQRKKKKK